MAGKPCNDHNDLSPAQQWLLFSQRLRRATAACVEILRAELEAEAAARAEAEAAGRPTKEPSHAERR